MAFPTETVYGLGSNALDAAAVARIFEAKQRPRFDPLIVHLADRDWLERVAVEVPPIARRLMDLFWPGPLTLVLPRHGDIPGIVSSGLDTIGVRVPEHPVARELIRIAGVPVAAPSANRFGSVSPTTAAHVAGQLGDSVDYILDGGPCRVGLESTVVSVVDDIITVLRPGGVPVEHLERAGGNVRMHGADGIETAPASPGRTLSHYAPGTPLVLRDEPTVRSDESHLRVGLIAGDQTLNTAGFATAELLPGNSPAAAADFFAALRRLDASALDLIVAVPFPAGGLGTAINDRLHRASKK